MKTLSAISASLLFGCSFICLHAQTGVLANETYNSSGGLGYTNASSIPVSSTDLLEGLTPISTNYVATHETTGGDLGVLTDGTTGVGLSAPTDSTNAAFDLNNSTWYAEYALPSSVNGFTINSVVVTTGHQDNRTNQSYDILVSTNGTNFFSLSSGATETLGNAGGDFSYSPSSGNGGAAQSTVTPTGANLGTGIKYVELVVQDGGSDVYRELDVTGAVAPEPSTWTEMALGAGILAFILLRCRPARS